METIGDARQRGVESGVYGGIRCNRHLRGQAQSGIGINEILQLNNVRECVYNRCCIDGRFEKRPDVGISPVAVGSLGPDDEIMKPVGDTRQRCVESGVYGGIRCDRHLRPQAVTRIGIDEVFQLNEVLRQQRWRD